MQIVTDSKVTEFIVPNLTSRSPLLLARLRELRALCEQEGIFVSTRHIPSAPNTWADRVSQPRDSHAWQLPTAVTRLLDSQWQVIAHVDYYLGRNELPGYIPPYREPLVIPRPSLAPLPNCL